MPEFIPGDVRDEPEDSGLFNKASHLVNAAQIEWLIRDVPTFGQVTACMITKDRRVFVRIGNRTHEVVEDCLQPSDKLLCWDCGMDICSEFINLRNEIWERLPGTRVPILCIGCVERRLSRRLVRGDFRPEPDRLRDGYCDFGPRSARLAIRLVDWERHGKARAGVAA